jgi:phosphoribosyl 1,2-cyclic phosphate phosphodiesterase
MKIKFLGTAAAEGWPAVFCKCDHCQRAKKAGGRNIRTRSQALINNDLLIDFPSDTNYHMLAHSLDLSAVKYLLITHSHLDHFAPIDLFFRSKSYYAHNLTEEKLYMYSNEAVLDRYNKALADYNEEPTDQSIIASFLPLYTPTKLDRYTVTALRANHAPEQTAYVYLIQDKDSTLLYLHDTGRLYDEVYDYLTDNRIKADLITFDCTYGLIKSGGGHLGIDSCQPERERLLEHKIAGKDTQMIVNHFSHNGGAIYDEMVPVAEELGFQTSFDGMEVEF